MINLTAQLEASDEAAEAANLECRRECHAHNCAECKVEGRLHNSDCELRDVDRVDEGDTVSIRENKLIGGAVIELCADCESTFFHEGRI